MVTVYKANVDMSANLQRYTASGLIDIDLAAFANRSN